MFRYLGGVTEVSYALGALGSLGLSWAVLSQSAGVFDLPMLGTYINWSCSVLSGTSHSKSFALRSSYGARRDT
jgi:hypothetical protein